MSAPGRERLDRGTAAGTGTWELPRHPVASRLARHELADALADLADDLVQVAELLTSELVTNAVEHGGGPITLRVLRSPHKLTVQVVDRGAAVPVVRAHDLMSLGGRGMQLVEALAAAWGSEPVVGGGEGKTVWFELDV